MNIWHFSPPIHTYLKIIEFLVIQYTIIVHITDLSNRVKAIMCSANSLYNEHTFNTAKQMTLSITIDMTCASHLVVIADLWGKAKHAL